MTTKRKKRKSPSKQWFIVYELVNISTKQKYIGITGVKNRKWEEYLKRRLDFHIKRAVSNMDTLICQNIREYGSTCFNIRELNRVQGKKPALELEKEYVKSGNYMLNMVHRTTKNITYKSILKRLKLPSNKPPLHPGAVLRDDFMPHIDIPLNDFAELVNFESTDFLQLLKEELCPTYTQCAFIAKVTGTPLKFWIKLVTDYKISEEIRTIDIEKYKNSPTLLKSKKVKDG